MSMDAPDVSNELPDWYAKRFWRDFPEELHEDGGTVRWFGQPWPSADFPAPVCRPDAHIRTPVGYHCMICRTAFALGDQGVRIPHLGERREFSCYHVDCWLGRLGVRAGIESEDGDRQEVRPGGAGEHAGGHGPR